MRVMKALPHRATVLVASLCLNLGICSCLKERESDRRPTPPPLMFLHDDPAKEVLVIVADDGTPDPDPVYVSWDGNGAHKVKYIRWVASTAGATLTVSNPSPQGTCPQFPKIECATGQCVSRDMNQNHKGCTYTYSLTVQRLATTPARKDPTIMIDR